jgi:hypothetical protein
MENSVSRPDMVNKLRFAVDAAFAMLAGMQLDVFTPLSNGAMTADEIANSLGVGAERLRLLIYCLVDHCLARVVVETNRAALRKQSRRRSIQILRHCVPCCRPDWVCPSRAFGIRGEH